nr:FAD-binding protein [Actinomadura sp. J1-007]
MSSLSRRKFVAGSATVGAASLVAQPQEAAAGAAAGGAPRSGPAVVTKDDPRYPTLVWGSNQRWVGTPDAVHVVTSTAQVVASVQEAVRTGKRVAVRSGGHCYENFVGDPAVRLVIDLSRLNAVYHDRQRGAFAVEPGRRSATRTGGSTSSGASRSPVPRARPSASAGMSSAAVSASCRGGTGRRWTTCTRSRSWWWTRTAPHARSSPPATPATRTGTCGGRTPGAAAATSAW